MLNIRSIENIEESVKATLLFFDFSSNSYLNKLAKIAKPLRLF